MTHNYKNIQSHTHINKKPHYLPKQIQTTSEVQPLTMPAKKWLSSLNAFQKCLSGPVGWDPACFALGAVWITKSHHSCFSVSMHLRMCV